MRVGGKAPEGQPRRGGKPDDAGTFSLFSRSGSNRVRKAFLFEALHTVYRIETTAVVMMKIQG
jgi:hypothetical protein